ncbi:aldehyde dehydrogenase family 7 member A1 [Pseudohyphozyma bogoriensis]|nr:aldehyde dehydrogenase family 7 member A1 [Pseudohyphozyma bogoriensis]
MPHATLTPASILSSLSISASTPNAGFFDGTSWGGSGPIIESINPATGLPIATVQTASKEEVDVAIKAARDAQKIWRGVTAPNRGEVLRKIGLKLREHKEALGCLISMEMGKIKSEGLGEVQEFIDVLDFAVGLSRSIGGSVVPSERNKHFITEVSNPLGLIGVITAFNFPNAVFGWNFSLAFITGNSTLWKPAPSTPLVSIATTKIVTSVLIEEGLPPALCTLLCGGTEVGQAVVEDPRVDLVSFTGSENVGRIVNVEVAKRFGKSLLELGGNNAAIVLPDANLALALQTTVFAALGTSGQRCTTTRRLFLHSSIAESFTSSLVAAYKSTLSRMGNPLDSNTLIGPIHAKDGVKRFVQALEEVKAQGGEILVGGNVAKVEGELKGGNWVEPTIVRVRDVKRMEVMKRETFAPILYVATYDTLEEAIELNNDVPQGLSSALFTQNMSSAFQFIGPNGSDTGIINVNGSTSGAEIGAPFGGNKSTGWGRESGGDSWKQYCRWSSCTLNWSNELGMAQGVKFE